MRELVKYWLFYCIKIVVFLDDGWGTNDCFKKAWSDSLFVKDSLLQAGFVENVEKSVWKPVQRIEWLGLIWDSCNFCLLIPEIRISDLKSILNPISVIPYRVTARGIARCAGKVISLIHVVGNIARIMTRYLYMEIQTRSAWHRPFSLSLDSPC